MLFSDRVREDLEREVLGKGFEVFYVETMRGDAALAPFVTPSAFVAFLRDGSESRTRRDAVAAALLRAYGASDRGRDRLGVLVLLAVWGDVAGVVRGKTRQLARRAGFTRTDADDVEQEIALDLLKRLARFDPSKASLRTFATRIVEHHVATLIESREAPCRDWRRIDESLDELIPDGAGEVVPRWRTLDQEEHAGRHRGEDRDERAAHELRIDVEAAVGSLDPALRDMAERLRVSTPTEIARAAGRPRTTVYESIGRLSDALGEAGLSGYVPTLRRARR